MYRKEQGHTSHSPVPTPNTPWSERQTIPGTRQSRRRHAIKTRPQVRLIPSFFLSFLRLLRGEERGKTDGRTDRRQRHGEPSSTSSSFALRGRKPTIPPTTVWSRASRNTERFGVQKRLEDTTKRRLEPLGFGFL